MDQLELEALKNQVLQTINDVNNYIFIVIISKGILRFIEKYKKSLMTS